MTRTRPSRKRLDNRQPVFQLTLFYQRLQGRYPATTVMKAGIISICPFKLIGLCCYVQFKMELTKLLYFSTVFLAPYSETFIYLSRHGITRKYSTENQKVHVLRLFHIRIWLKFIYSVYYILYKGH